MGRLKEDRVLMELIKTLMIIGLTTLVASALVAMGVREINIILMFLIGILIITIETRGYMWGIISSLVIIIIFNFLFTEPKYTLQMTDANNIFTLILFFLVSIITSTLVSRLQLQTEGAKRNEKQAKLLHKVSLGFLNVSGLDNIKNYIQDILNQIQGSKVEIYYTEEISEKDILGKWCITNIMPCGMGTSYFMNEKKKYLPIKSKSMVYGVVSFDCSNGDIKDDDMVYINAVIAQMVIAIQNDNLDAVQEDERIEKEKQHLEMKIISKIIKEIKEPILSIEEECNKLLENTKVKKNSEALETVYRIDNNILWLDRQTENLISAAHMINGDLKIIKKYEGIRELFELSTELMKMTASNIKFDIILNENIYVQMDMTLMEQVIVNLLDCVIKENYEKSRIIFDAYMENNYLVIEIAYQNKFHSIDFKREQGEAYSIELCRSIIEAHDGNLVITNNTKDESIFKIKLHQ